MNRSPRQLRADALEIWRAGVQAVLPGPLVFDAMRLEGPRLCIADEAVELAGVERIVVVGGGKAAGAMAVAVEQALGPTLLNQKHVAGWVNVPEGCVLPTDRIRLHAARPAGVNEPTEAGVAGVREMLRLVAGLGPRDLCLCLVSGGGSALMPAPIDGYSLADKIELTRALAASGASIDQINAVRRELSAIKGGALAGACGEAAVFALILSDVPGDDLAAVASGPTVRHNPAPAEAAETLRMLGLADLPAARRAIDLLSKRPQRDGQQRADDQASPRVRNILIGNNAAAVDAAGVAAERLGYSHAMISANKPEGWAEDVGRHLAETAARMRGEAGPDCLITGGEPTVRLAPAEQRGRGGRNQQLALAAFAALDDWRGVALVAGGTDGEDGPTDAAGALVDEAIAAKARELRLDADDYLVRNDAYRFFEAAEGLLFTGPTHTNVCDLRVVTVGR